jgi:ribosome-associated translation inhibitor RaiA
MRLQVNGLHLVLTDHLLDHVDRRFRFALDRIESQVSRVAVRLEDIHGNSNGGPKECRVLLKMISGETLVLHENGTNLYDLVDRASEKTKRLVNKRIEKGRTIRRHALPVLADGSAEEEAE